jgi:hypothetical protein
MGSCRARWKRQGLDNFGLAELESATGEQHRDQ